MVERLCGGLPAFVGCDVETVNERRYFFNQYFIFSEQEGFLASHSHLRPITHAASRHGTHSLTSIPKDGEASCLLRPPRRGGNFHTWSHGYVSPLKMGFEPQKSLNICLRIPDHENNTWSHSKYKNLYFGCDTQEFLIGRRANYSSVGLKYILGGFLNARPCCIFNQQFTKGGSSVSVYNSQSCVFTVLRRIFVIIHTTKLHLPLGVATAALLVTAAVDVVVSWDNIAEAKSTAISAGLGAYSCGRCLTAVGALGVADCITEIGVVSASRLEFVNDVACSDCVVEVVSAKSDVVAFAGVAATAFVKEKLFGCRISSVVK